MIVVDVDSVTERPPTIDEFGGVVIGLTNSGRVPTDDPTQAWIDHASLTLTEEQTDDRRMIHVESIPDAIDEISARVAANRVAATVCDDVLRAGSEGGDLRSLLTTESLAYSTLQAGAEFERWHRAQGPRVRHEQGDDTVLLARDGDDLSIRFNRPDRHNAFSNALRAGLIDGLRVALGDDSITSVAFAGNGPSFCSGGDLKEFGLFSDPADAHLARTRYSPAVLLDALTTRLGSRLRAYVHGSVLGSGLEMAAFCGTVTAHPETVFGLPELGLGLIPGAGGTISVPRRIGRWRTAYLVLSGATIDVATAVDWGLIDGVGVHGD